MLRRLNRIGAHLAGASFPSASLRTQTSVSLINCTVLMSTSSSTSDERLKSDAAAQRRDQDVASTTIFDKIIDRTIPAKIAYEDAQCLAFHDVSPQAPVHILIIPKHRDGLTQLSKAEPRHKEILGHLMLVAQQVAEEQKLDNGFRIVINDGRDGCQSVFHLHLHLLGGRKLSWPPG